MEFWDVPAGVNMATAENIEAAATAIDDVFLNTPQYRSEGLSELCNDGRRAKWWRRRY